MGTWGPVVDFVFKLVGIAAALGLLRFLWAAATVLSDKGILRALERNKTEHSTLVIAAIGQRRAEMKQEIASAFAAEGQVFQQQVALAQTNAGVLHRLEDETARQSEDLKKLTDVAQSVSRMSDAIDRLEASARESSQLALQHQAQLSELRGEMRTATRRARSH